MTLKYSKEVKKDFMNPKTYKVQINYNTNLSPRYLLLNMPGFIFNSGGNFYE
jgi:hypothetical protein